MSNASDVPTPISLHRASAIDLDDAFSDGEENGMSHSFSPGSIRDDLAKTMETSGQSWGTPAGLYNYDGFLDGPISIPPTISNDEEESHREVGSRSPTPLSPSPSALTAEFSQVSLETPTEEVPVDKFDNGLPAATELSEDQEVVPYPNVIIDASQMPNHDSAVSRVQEVQGSSTEPPDPQHALVQEAAHSSPSLPTAPPPQHERINSASASSLASAPVSTTATGSASNKQTPEIKTTQTPFRHRPTRSVGPSALEKVRSRTRPAFLPPKSRQEDDKHMADWEAMMQQSRITAEKRRKALQERRVMREARVEASLSQWEKEILPDWTVVHRNPGLRKLWWSGIPTKLRASMWEKAVGNGLALSKEHYRTCLARAKRALASGSFPEATLSKIEQDIATTLPALHIFHHESGPLYGDLKDMLCAWVVSRSDEGLGYSRGAARIAAMLVINMPIPQGFVVMRNLLERHIMRSFFGGPGTKDDVEAYFRIFDTLLADGMPKVYFNFKQHQISPAAYLPDWLIPLFLDHLPFEACAHLWDVLLLEGDSLLFRAALAILAVLEPRLFFPDRKELLELLRGENKAALDVARREGRPLDGGKYEIYGLDEETLWERIDGMQDWWKESTWVRLIQRELPDL